MRIKRSKYPVVLTKLRWLEANELDNQKEFGREITQINIELPKIHLMPRKSSKFDGWNKYGGFLFAIFAALCYSIAALTSKLLIQQNFHIFTIALWKSIGMTAAGSTLLIFFLLLSKQPILECLLAIPGIPDGKKTLLLLIGAPVLGFAGILFQIESLRHLNLADSTAITFSSPIVAGFLIVALAGEPHWRGVIFPVLTGLVTLGGVIILTRPPQFTNTGGFDYDVLMGAGFALGCMLSLTAGAIFLRSLQHVHACFLIFCHGFVATIGSVILLAIIGRLTEIPQTEEDWTLVGGNAIFSLLGQGLLILSFKCNCDESSGISGYFAQTTGIVLSFIWQFIFLGVYPDVLSMIGAGVIIFGISTSALENWLKSSATDAQTPQALTSIKSQRSWSRLK